MSNNSYTVIKDTREQTGWHFPAQQRCLGTTISKLDTGDYSIEGLEKQFVIERKGCSSEFASNLFQKRFANELDRLDKFKHAYLFLEFEPEHIINFPFRSGIPTHLQKNLKITPQLFLMKFHEMQIAHPNLHVLFVGRHGKEFASSLFKRIVDGV